MMNVRRIPQMIVAIVIQIALINTHLSTSILHVKQEPAREPAKKVTRNAQMARRYFVCEKVMAGVEEFLRKTGTQRIAPIVLQSKAVKMGSFVISIAVIQSILVPTPNNPIPLPLPRNAALIREKGVARGG